MAHDFKHKEPSKTEKILYELMMNQQGMERALWSNSSVTMVLAMMQNIDPQKLAEALVEKEQEMKEYSKKVNESIKKLEEEKHKNHKHEEVAAGDAVDREEKKDE